MSLLSSFFFFLALLLVLSCLRKNAEVLSPGKVFAFIWLVALGFTDLKLSRLQHEWHLYAWVTIFLGVVSFLAGIFIVNILYINTPSLSVQQIRKTVKQLCINERLLLTSIVALFSAYLLVFLAEWFHYGALPIFAAYPDRARSEFPLFGLHLFIGAMPVILFLIVQYFLLVRRKKFVSMVLGAMFMITGLSYMLLLNRLYYVLFFVMILGFLYYSSQHVSFKNILFSFIALLSVLMTMQSFRETRYVENFLYVVSDMRYSPQYAGLTGPYMYLVMNLENFARGVTKLEQYTVGYFTTDFIMALTGLKHWLAAYFTLQERPFLVSGYNTFPFFWDYYRDFGLLGLTMLPCLLGFLIALLHRRMRSHPTLLNISLYSVAIFFMIFSFFTNALTSLNFVFNIFVLVTIELFIVRKTNQKSNLPDSLT